MKPELGLIGLGNIGEPICCNLFKEGYDVLVYDVDQEAMARLLADIIAEPAKSPRALASAADVVLLSLPNLAGVEDTVNVLMVGCQAWCSPCFSGGITGSVGPDGGAFPLTGALRSVPALGLCKDEAWIG